MATGMAGMAQGMAALAPVQPALVAGLWTPLQQAAILKACEDFANETPRLEFIAHKYLGAFIRLTPKCHPEIAGRGIEYMPGGMPSFVSAVA
jgi:hypothetical protein